MPAIPTHTAQGYVAAAYAVALALVVIYVAIMVVRHRRLNRELAELERAERAQLEEAAGPAPAGAPRSPDATVVG